MSKARSSNHSIVDVMMRGICFESGIRQESAKGKGGEGGEREGERKGEERPNLVSDTCITNHSTVNIFWTNNFFLFEM